MRWQAKKPISPKRDLKNQILTDLEPSKKTKTFLW